MTTTHKYSQVTVTPYGAKKVRVHNQPDQYGDKPHIKGVIVARGFSKVLIRYESDSQGNALPKNRRRDVWHNEWSVQYVG